MDKKISFEQFKTQINNDPKPWYVYMVRCSDNSLYCGVTIKVDKRIATHNGNKGAKYINKKRVPVKIAWISDIVTKHEALKLERQIKTLSKFEKEKMCHEWENNC